MGEELPVHNLHVWHTFPLVAQLVVVLPQLGDQLRSLELDLGVGGQVVAGGGLLSDHGVGLHVQVPVNPENTDQSKRSFNKTKQNNMQYSHSWSVRRGGGARRGGCGGLGLFVLRGGAPGFDPRSAGRDGRGRLHLVTDRPGQGSLTCTRSIIRQSIHTLL